MSQSAVSVSYVIGSAHLRAAAPAARPRRSPYTERMTPQLSDKRARFAEEYLIDSNATRAAIRAGYSPRSAPITGHRLLMDANVRAAIANGRARIMLDSGITSALVLERLWAIAEDIETPHATRVRGYELAGKHLGMFTDKVEHSGGLGVTVVRATPELDEDA